MTLVPNAFDTRPRSRVWSGGSVNSMFCPIRSSTNERSSGASDSMNIG